MLYFIANARQRDAVRACWDVTHARLRIGQTVNLNFEEWHGSKFYPELIAAFQEPGGPRIPMRPSWSPEVTPIELPG